MRTVVGAHAILDQQKLWRFVANLEEFGNFVGNRAVSEQIEVVRFYVLQTTIRPLALEPAFGGGAYGAAGAVLKNYYRLLFRFFGQGFYLRNIVKLFPLHIFCKINYRFFLNNFRSFLIGFGP